MLYLIDHNDSFTYNLVAQIRSFYPELCIVNESDAALLLRDEAIVTGLIFSPGPKQPSAYPNSLALIEAYAGRVPIIGVCLGHQMLGHVFGGRVVRGKKPVQGYVEMMNVDATDPLFCGIESPFLATRYHSLHVIDLPDTWRAIGWSPDGAIQVMRHVAYPMYGIQFHPESVGTPRGEQLMKNIFKEAGLWNES